jgi:histone H3/H4
MAEKPVPQAAPAKPERTDGFISKAPIRRLMKDQGAFLVADEAVEFMIDHLQKLGIAITKKAVENVEKAGLKKLMSIDVLSASKETTL